MNISNQYIFLSIAVITCVTFSIRVAPFIFFGKKETPKYIVYLGKYLPPAIISMLIIYCLRNVGISSFPFGLPEAIGILVVAVLHIWKRNNLISIIGGTVIYMVSIQLIFV